MSNDVSLGLAHEVEVALRKAGATRENFWVPLSQNEDLAKRVLNFVNINPIYNITVDYSRSLDEMINAGNYDWFNYDITAEHFPIEGEGKHERAVTLFHFNRNINSKDAITEMDRQEYRPATVEEILALGEFYPEIQREFPIVALGSIFWYPHNSYNGVSCLNESDSDRNLGLGWFENDWEGYWRFAAVCK